jgi:hypothetical protein
MRVHGKAAGRSPNGRQRIVHALSLDTNLSQYTCASNVDEKKTYDARPKFTPFETLATSFSSARGGKWRKSRQSKDGKDELEPDSTLRLGSSTPLFVSTNHLFVSNLRLYSSSLLFIATLRRYSSSLLFVATLRRYSSSLLFILVLHLLRITISRMYYTAARPAFTARYKGSYHLGENNRATAPAAPFTIYCYSRLGCLQNAI